MFPVSRTLPLALCLLLLSDSDCCCPQPAAAKQAESDVHSHYAEELERLETDMSKRIDLSKRAFPAWAKKFNYTLQSADEGSGRMMIVATKREPTINAEYLSPPPPPLPW